MEESTVIDASGQFMWFNVAYNFIDSNVKPETTKLDFSTNHVSEMSAELLAFFLTKEDYSLTELNLTQCRLTEKASIQIFEALGKSKITSLTLDRNLLTVACCKALAKALYENKNIVYLSLRSCDILYESMQHLCTAISQSPNLRVLRLDDNSIFDNGAFALAKAIKTSNISSLSVSDNQIWKDGLNNLLRSIGETGKMEELDVSYNILDLEEMMKLLQNSPKLTALNISGCKVNERLVGVFLDFIPRTQISTLMINGLNYNMLPIAWPHVKDEVWKDRMLFQKIMEAIKRSPTLVDVRVGFIESDQLSRLITFIEEELHQGQFQKKLSLSIIDFGRTENCWVATFPYFELHSPCDVFKWSSQLTTANAAKDITTFIRASKFDGVSVTKVDLSGCSMTNEALRQLLSGLRHSGIDELNISDNNFDDEAVSAITDFLSESSVNVLKIEGSKLTDVGLSNLFHFLASKEGSCNPYVLSVSYETGELNENIQHKTFTELAEVLGRDSRLQHLTIKGPITAQDAAVIIAPLSNNERLQSLKLLGKIPEKYAGSSPTIDPIIADNYARMARNLHTVLTNPDSRCRLSEFEFPLFSQMFLYNDQVLEFWSEVETKLDENKAM